jgi:dienelactone hydrolase
MIRFWGIVLLAASGFGGLASAQGVGNESSPRADLEYFLKTQAARLLAKRRAEVAAIKTPHDIEVRQLRLRRFFTWSLGDLPERTPLSPRIVGRKQYPGYRLERIIFESRPRHHVTAALYLPEGTPPFPGVLVPCGHTASGKAGDTYQQMCILLAKSGMAAFCYDPIGQGERVQKLDERGKPAIREGSTTEHTTAGIGALLVGRQAATYRIWDGMRALDYLASRPEIDPTKLGCTGNSGGGTMTAYLMALDPRIAVAAPSCYITSLSRLFSTIGPQDAEQNITGQVAAGMDHADYLILRAPKPTLITVGTQDFFDIRGSWDTFREVKLLYGRLGFGERVDLFESDEPHGFTAPRRVATARWMRRWLLGKDDAIAEPDSPTAPERDLQCTRTGQVLTDLGGVSVFDLNAARETELRPERTRFCRAATAIEFRSKVKELLALGGWTAAPGRLAIGGHAPAPSFCRVRTIRTSSEPGIRLQAVELIPEWPNRSLPIVVRIGFDLQTELAEGGPAEQLVRRGRRVVLANPRGMGGGSERDREGRGESPLGRDVQAAFLSLHIGRPLLGQRVMDVLSLLESLKVWFARFQDADSSGFEVVAKGPAGLAALHATVLDEHNLIRRLSLDHCLVSWTDVVRRGGCRDQLGSVVPGVLRYYDLPDLVARLDPLEVEIRSPVDAQGQLVGASERAGAERK